MKHILLIGWMILVAGKAWSTDELEKRNLQDTWQVYADGVFRSFDPNQDGTVRTLYLTLDAELYRGDYLLIEADQPVSLFVNQKLIRSAFTVCRLPVDSLAALYNPIQVAVYHHDVLPAIRTTIISLLSHQVAEEERIYQKPPTAFRDFIIVAVSMLLIFFIILVRINPRVAQDYFSVMRVFSLRENEDVQSYKRVLSVSILFYVFVSLLVALFLLLVAHITKGLYVWEWYKDYHSFWMYSLQWILVSMAILLVLFLKLITIHILAYLFGLSDAASFHFFNFVRVLLILFVMLTLVAGGYFILQGYEPGLYVFLFKAARMLIIFWTVLLFLKLTHLASFTKFHLFSYLCATEILPLLLIAKFLYR